MSTEFPFDAPAPGDVPLEEFREAMARATEWIADYLANPGHYPVLSRATPGDTLGAVPEPPPTHGDSLQTILDDVERVVLPGITHWNHPGFFAYFAISSSAPGILGELLAAALDTNAMLWRTSPSATELEQRALDWLRQLMGLGRGWFGEITDTASTSTLYALAAAREAKVALDIRQRGMAGRADLPALRVYCSEQAHSSVDKAVITLGLGHEHLVKIPVDDAYRMRPDALEAAIAEDRAAGRIPLAVVATVGTTATASVDPVPEIAEIARAAGAWLHVDCAYGGAAAVVPEWQGLLDGVDLADSFVVNPHKWLFVPVDCSALYVKHPDVLRRAFSLVPAYLQTNDGDVVNLMDYGFQLGRRFRALKLWMVLRAFGAEGMAARIRHHVQLAQAFAAQVRAEAGWTVVAPVGFSLVCCRWAPDGWSPEEADAANLRIVDAVNASGRVFLAPTRLGERTIIRLAIGNIRTEASHVAEAWRLLREAAAQEVTAGPR